MIAVGGSYAAQGENHYSNRGGRNLLPKGKNCRCQKLLSSKLNTEPEKQLELFKSVAKDTASATRTQNPVNSRTSPKSLYTAAELLQTVDELLQTTVLDKGGGRKLETPPCRRSCQEKEFAAASKYCCPKDLLFATKESSQVRFSLTHCT